MFSLKSMFATIQELSTQKNWTIKVFGTNHKTIQSLGTQPRTNQILDTRQEYFVTKTKSFKATSRIPLTLCGFTYSYYKTDCKQMAYTAWAPLAYLWRMSSIILPRDVLQFGFPFGKKYGNDDATESKTKEIMRSIQKSS